MSQRRLEESGESFRVFCVKASDYFELPQSMPFGDFFKADMRPWEWISQIKPALNAFEAWSKPEGAPLGAHIEGDVYIHESVKLPAYCSIAGPAWIGENVEIRPGAFIRGNVIIGAGSLLGNSCEYKNCLLMENVQTPHYNYVGDSVLGSGAHLGAGVILSNLRLDQKNIVIRYAGDRLETGLRKFGALFGEHAEAGCNCVLNPGSILGKRALLGPLSAHSGVLDGELMSLSSTRPMKLPRRD